MASRELTIKWLRGLAEEGGEGVVNNIDARCLGRIASDLERLHECLSDLVNAKALSEVRRIVAGWDGEDRPEPYRHRHPSELGATIPKTTCGAIYALDEAMQRARAALASQKRD